MADEQNLDGTGNQAPEGQAAAGATQTPGWLAQLPDTYKGNEAFTGFKTVGDFAADYLALKGKAAELEGKVTDTIPKLPENATDEQKAAYYAALGRPETPDKYELAKPDLPDGLPYDEAVESWFRGTAHALGLTQEQAGKLFAAYNDLTKQAFTTQEAARTKAYADGVEALKKEWGPEGYPANVEVMRRAVEQFGGPDFKAFMDESGLGNNPIIIKTFVAIGKSMGEDSSLTAARPGAQPATPGMHYEIVDVKPPT